MSGQALVAAAAADDIATIKRLLKEGASVDELDDFGISAIYMAFS